MLGYLSLDIICSSKLTVRFSEQIKGYCLYMWKKKTNKVQVHPYKRVSWSLTHQGMIYIYIYIK